MWAWSRSRKSLVHLLFLLYLLLLGEAQKTGLYWQLYAAGKRYIRTDKLIGTCDGNRAFCTFFCVSQNCISFNHNEIERQCEIFSWAQGDVEKLTSDANWNYYVQMRPPLKRFRDPCASSPCPEGSMCVRYTQPVFERFVTDLDFYICTSHHLLANRGFTSHSGVCYLKNDYYTNAGALGSYDSHFYFQPICE
ncbi:uncharacterized protein LOC143018135 isoform X2 [Oratosquilla oratoria]|uniref:uncharacterized protein LOC143018135 isoform X2 n=1 Tax=Oratosquilla oratoria TaxID=337810 RepID=UPI003F75EBD6